MTWDGPAGWLPALLMTGLWLSARGRLARTRHLTARAEHELRGPIGAVSLGIERALQPGQSTAQTLSAVRAELDRVALALTDLAAARGGRCGPSTCAAVDLAQVITDSVEAWRPVAAAAGVELELCWEGLRQPVIGDRVRIAQATGNLIANAIEHGGGRVLVSAGCDGQRARVQVSDGGPGLCAAAITDAVGTGSSSARGHGLAVAAGVAVSHGGTLRAVVEPPGRAETVGHGGAALVLELPVATPA